MRAQSQSRPQTGDETIIGEFNPTLALVTWPWYACARRQLPSHLVSTSFLAIAATCLQAFLPSLPTIFFAGSSTKVAVSAKPPCFLLTKWLYIGPAVYSCPVSELRVRVMSVSLDVCRSFVVRIRTANICLRTSSGYEW